MTTNSANWLGFIAPLQGDEGSPTRQGLQRLLLLRGFAALCSATGIILFQIFSDAELPAMMLAGLSLAVLASLAVGYWRLQHSVLISNTELLGHLILDTVFLALFVFNTGGVSNPLISYLLVLLAVAATILPRSYVNAFALGSILVYTSFLLLDLTSEHESPAGIANQEMTFQLHLVGMWVIFLVSAILISVFITGMAREIRIRETNLATARENEMRNEQLVAIGTLAAGTAHALGTPLSTMSVLLADLDDLDTESLADQQVKDDIRTLRNQVKRCKHSLSQLVHYYHKEDAIAGACSTIQAFIGDVRDYIVNIHPKADVEFRPGGASELEIEADPRLRHAVINIIENSIKAARQKVIVTVDSNESRDLIEIAIQDDGPGIPQEVMENMGVPFISTRKDSMGLGIFLANATIQRLGGTIEMFNMKSGGALTRLRLPATGGDLP